MQIFLIVLLLLKSSDLFGLPLNKVSKNAYSFEIKTGMKNSENQSLSVEDVKEHIESLHWKSLRVIKNSEKKGTIYFINNADKMLAAIKAIDFQKSLPVNMSSVNVSVGATKSKKKKKNNNSEIQSIENNMAMIPAKSPHSESAIFYPMFILSQNKLLQIRNEKNAREMSPCTIETSTLLLEVKPNCLNGKIHSFKDCVIKSFLTIEQVEGIPLAQFHNCQGEFQLNAKNKKGFTKTLCQQILYQKTKQPPSGEIEFKINK